MKKTLIWVFVLLIVIHPVSALSIGNFWATLFGEVTSPEVMESLVTPVGNQLLVKIVVKDKYGVKNASVLGVNRNGDVFLPMALVSSDSGIYTYEVLLKSKEMPEGWYETGFVITNNQDKSTYGFVVW